MPNLNSTISAHIGIAHIEFNEYLDHEAERAASVIDKYIKQMVDAAKGSQHPYQLLHRLYIISNELPKAVGKACYEALHNCGRMSASRVVKALDRAIPRDGGFDVHVKEAVGAILQAILKPFRKPVARIRNIISDMLIEPIKRSVLERIVLGGAVVISRLMTTVKQAFSPQRVADILVRDISEGKDRRAQITSLRNELAMPRAAAKRTVRTEGIRVATESNMAAYEELGDITIGYAIHALLDEATRPEHRARNGTIYYKYPVGGQKGISEMPRPPIEPDGSIAWNCRCYLSPVFESLENFEMPTSSNVLPSILVYQDWWKNASDAKKRIAVGVRRFNYVTQRYGADASYSHFIDADGQLLSIDTLTAETAEQAAERIAANDALSNEARKRRASLLLTGGA